MRISDWSSDVCSSDLQAHAVAPDQHRHGVVGIGDQQDGCRGWRGLDDLPDQAAGVDHALALGHAVAGARVEDQALARGVEVDVQDRRQLHVQPRLEEHTSELQTLLRIAISVFCLTNTKYYICRQCCY